MTRPTPIHYLIVSLVLIVATVLVWPHSSAPSNRIMRPAKASKPATNLPVAKAVPQTTATPQITQSAPDISSCPSDDQNSLDIYRGDLTSLQDFLASGGFYNPTNILTAQQRIDGYNDHIRILTAEGCK